MSGCPSCSSPLGYQWPPGGRFPGCTQCDRAWVPEDTLGATGWSRARLSAHAFAAGGACATCGGKLVERTLTGSEARLATGYCSACRTLAAPLSQTIVFLKRLNGIAVPEREPRDEPRPAPRPERVRTFRARDRLVAFFLMLPLELSEDVRNRPPGVMSLVYACCGVFGLFLLTDGGAAVPLVLSANESWLARVPHLATCLFVHFSLFHLLGNLYFLYAFGRLMEERLGTARLIAFFLACGVAGSLAFAVVHLGDKRMLGGASGAVAGLMGCYLVLYPWRMLGFSVIFTVVRIPALFYLGLWFMFQVFSVPYQERGIAYSAHAGGFLAGLLGGAAVRAELPGFRAIE
jgi:membrane associated rhomboid family serine protease